MISKAGMGDKIDAQLIRTASLAETLALGGNVLFEHYRKGRLIDRDLVHNKITNEGLNELLDVMFKSATQITAWYVVLFEDDYTPDGDETYAVPEYTECTAYDESDRPAWQGGSVSGQSVDNSANRASFTMNATKTLYGAALVGGGTDADTKSDTAGGGTLYNLARFSSSKSVVSTDEVKITITLTSSSTT